MKEATEAMRIVERMMGAPAPVAPPQPGVKPGVKPAPGPVRPAPTPMPRRPDPWRRRTGETERPQARFARPTLRAEAEELLRRNGMEYFLK